MNLASLRKIHTWFDSYIRGFYTDDKEVAPLIRIKEEHSRIVAGHARAIAKSIGWGNDDVNLAEALGLCHDVGRFKQATIYKTFKDKDSVNHGQLGAEELNASGINIEFEPGEWEPFLFAVKWHNAASVPKHPGEKWNHLTKLIRDADKLDIYRVLPPRRESDGCTPAIIDGAAAGRLLRYEDLKTIDDKKVIMLSWVYDINFSWTMRQVLAAGYLDRLWEALPPGPGITNFRRRVEDHVAKTLSLYPECERKGTVCSD